MHDDELTEHDRVIGWRAQQLMDELGLRPKRALILAENITDVRAYINEYRALEAAGCTRATIHKILRPVHSPA